jgi:hypothetical protein
MWQIICLCLPAATRCEQQRFFALFGDVIRTYGREPGHTDLSLSFLYTLSPLEALTVLEERLDLVQRSQELLASAPQAGDDIQELITDHLRTLLEAELTWIERAIARLRSQGSAG